MGEIYILTRKIIFLGAMLVSACFGCQIVKISGKITDARENPIFGVMIYIENNFSESETDEAGRFEIQTESLKLQDTIVLVTHKRGYSDTRKEIVIESTTINNVQINIGEKVVVVEDVFIEKKQSKDIAELKPFSKSDIEVILSSPESSILSSMNYLPGVQQVGETGELSVRGGDGSETRYIFDGMLVNNMVGANIDGQAGGSRLSPVLFKDMTLVQGGYSAEFGNALSSILKMTSKDIAYNKSFSFMISPFSADAQLVLPFNKEKKESLEIGINFMDFDLYSNVMKDDLDYQSLKKGPYSLSGNIFYKNNFSDKLKFKFFSNNSFTRIDALALDIDNPAQELSSKVENLNYFNQATLLYEHNANTKVFFGINNTLNSDETEFRKNENSIFYQRNFNITQIKTSIHKKLGKDSYLNTGAEYFIEKSDLQNLAESFNYTNNYGGIYSEFITRLYKNIYANAGVRAEYSWLVRKANLGGRYDLKFVDNGNKNEVGLSYGNFYQQPALIYKSDFNNLKFSRADHMILYYRYRNNGRNISLELYDKKYRNLISYTSPKASYDGYGYARGVDIYFRDGKSFRNLEYRLSYSYTDAQRKYLNYPIEAAFHLNSKNKYSFSANYSFFGGDLLWGVYYNYATGRPYYNPNLSTSLFNSEKTKDIHDLSTNFIYSFKVKSTPMLFIFSVSNILGNDKIFGYTYSENNPQIRREVSPMYRRFFFVGLNIALGLSKNNDLIDQILNRK